MGLAASGRVRELVLVDVAGSGLREKAAALISSYDVRVRAVETEPRDQYSFERLLRDLAPDLVIQAAALQSPWALVGRDDPVATTLNRVGLAIRLPFQLPCLLAAMRAVRETGYEGPVANISLPDITHPILARHGLTPTVGLGNVSMQLLRARAAWRARNGDAAGAAAARGRPPQPRLRRHAGDGAGRPRRRPARLRRRGGRAGRRARLRRPADAAGAAVQPRHGRRGAAGAARAAAGRRAAALVDAGAARPAGRVPGAVRGGHARARPAARRRPRRGIGVLPADRARRRRRSHRRRRHRALHGGGAGDDGADRARPDRAAPS